MRYLKTLAALLFGLALVTIINTNNPHAFDGVRSFALTSVDQIGTAALGHPVDVGAQVNSTVEAAKQLQDLPAQLKGANANGAVTCAADLRSMLDSANQAMAEGTDPMAATGATMPASCDQDTLMQDVTSGDGK